MSQFHRPDNSGAPTFASGFASLNLSGLDPDFTADALDPELLDGSDWFPQNQSPGEHHQQHHAHHPQASSHEHAHAHAHAHHHSPQSPQQLHGSLFPAPLSPGLPMSSHGGLAHTPYPTLPNLNHMESAVPMQPRLDNLLISPISAPAAYPPFTGPYTESTASSAPSTEDVFADHVAEEEKRKRNQAASARFRQKKKQREQQMLEQSRELAERTKKLENDVDTLTRENKFLKRLLVEKVENMSPDEKEILKKTTGLGESK